MIGLLEPITRPLLRLIGALDDLLEPIDDLLFGAAEPVAQPIEKPHAVSLRLRPLRAQHQAADSGPRVFPARQELGNLTGNRQFHPVARAEGQRRVGGPDTFGHHLHAGQDLLQRSDQVLVADDRFQCIEQAGHPLPSRDERRQDVLMECRFLTLPVSDQQGGSILRT